MRVPAAVLALPLLAILAATGASVAADSAADKPETAAADKATKGSGVPQKRIAFVVGDGAYAAGPLPTAGNDAGLVAQTLLAGGFEVIGARDLEGEALRQSYADFLKRLGDAGPDTVAFVYLSGYGLQYGDSNYYVPVGAAVSGAVDIPVQAMRLTDLTGPLAALPLRARFAVFDAAYRAPFKVDGNTVGGFALADAGPDALVAFNAAPGTVAAPGKGNFGAYALALAGTMREPGLSPEQLFERVRLRVSADTDGGEVPWDASRVDEGFRFFEDGRAGGAKAASPAAAGRKASEAAPRPGAAAAYAAAVASDTLAGYDAFARDFAADPLAARARVLLALRREALTWHRAATSGTPAALRAYLDRYAGGEHAELARRRLAELSAPPMPPPGAKPAALDVPPPPEGEAAIVAGPGAVDLAALGLPAPPAATVADEADGSEGAGRVAEFAADAAPPSRGLFSLPVPRFAPLPPATNPPEVVAYPANNPFFAGSLGDGVPFGGNVPIGSRMVMNRIHRAADTPGGAPAAANGVALPDAVARRSHALESRGISTPAQLAALRGRPGGVVGALADRDAALLPDTRDAAFSPQRGSVAVAKVASAAAAEPSGSAVRTGRSSRVDGPVEAPAAVDAPVRAASPATPPIIPIPQRPRVGEAARKTERPSSVASHPPAVPRLASIGDANGGDAGRGEGIGPDRAPSGRELGGHELGRRELVGHDTGRRVASRPAARGDAGRGHALTQAGGAKVRTFPVRGDRLVASRNTPYGARDIGPGDTAFREIGPGNGRDNRAFVPRPDYFAGPRPDFVPGPRFGGYVLSPPGRFGGPRPVFVLGPRFARPFGRPFARPYGRFFGPRAIYAVGPRPGFYGFSPRADAFPDYGGNYRRNF